MTLLFQNRLRFACKAVSTMLLLVLCLQGRAQVNQITVLLGTLEDAALTPENIFDFRVQNNAGASRQATVKGTVRYRNSPLRFSYTFRTLLSAGLNIFSRDKVVAPQWSFSDNALKELFLQYRKLPQGTYEYCVEITTQKPGPEVIPDEPVDACTYHRMEDIFLINLVEPEDKARIHESYPVFNWVVNYPFASALTYKIRVAEQKPGQNPQNAITRNNPVYTEHNLPATTQTYPLTARPLEKWQPYVWTVDAYYKGILLGGAETWRFMIVEDSVLQSVPRNISYYEFATHYGESPIYGLGKVKLQYNNDRDSNALSFEVEGHSLKLKPVNLVLGDNRIDLDLQGKGLKHLHTYKLNIADQKGKRYIVPFIYVNPDFL